MFIIVALICINNEASSCEVFSNKKELFPTEELCLARAEEDKKEFTESAELGVNYWGCIKVPEGEKV